MTFLKSQKRFGQFETLETKKLFAADLAASADVVSLDPGDCVSALTAGVVDPNDTPSLGGQEGEPVVGAVDHVFQISEAPEGSLSAIAGPQTYARPRMQ